MSDPNMEGEPGLPTMEPTPGFRGAVLGRIQALQAVRGLEREQSRRLHAAYGLGLLAGLILLGVTALAVPLHAYGIARVGEALANLSFILDLPRAGAAALSALALAAAAIGLSQPLRRAPSPV